MPPDDRPDGRPDEPRDDTHDDTHDDTPDGRPDRRRPRSVYGVGDEPDPRFSMANERTALAWVRTSLAFVAGGVGLTSVAHLAGMSSTFLDVVAAALCLLGAALAVSAVLGWQRRESAMRLDRPLPAPAALPWLGLGVIVAALALAAYVLGAFH